jgi:RHS repeat-associated protein
LGSTSLITNLDGDLVQHVEYTPFGEVFIEERNNTWNTPYLFNAKELDEETGLIYFGMRYYDPHTSIWLSSDPLAEQAPGWSPYRFGFNNPVRFLDPIGLFETETEAETYRQDNNLTGDILFAKDKNEYFISQETPYNCEDDAGVAVHRNFGESNNQNDGMSGTSFQKNSLGIVSTVFGTTGTAGSIAETSNSTFRLTNGTNGTFSPKIYESGWKGGSRARITTYSVSKVGGAVSFGSGVITTGNAYYDIMKGKQQPITYVDAAVGTAGIASSVASYYTGAQIPYVGGFVAIYGTFRLTWDVFFYLGGEYGPSKWHGTDDTKWFK